MLGIYGENDERINAKLPEVTAAMQSDGKTFTPEVFPGTGHGFLKPGRQGSEGPQPAKAWDRILEFYRARLGKYAERAVILSGAKDLSAATPESEGSFAALRMTIPPASFTLS